jgi:hypothetical protein
MPPFKKDSANCTYHSVSRIRFNMKRYSYLIQISEGLSKGSIFSNQLIKFAP